MAADQYCLKWNNHQSTLLVQFETLLESDSLTDCTLSAEGKYLNVHKVLLSACSPYFSKLLGEHKDKHPIFFMKDVAFEELKGIVEYMYKGEVNVMQERLDSFLRTATSLQIKGLADQDGGKGEEREEDPGGGRVKRKQPPDLRGYESVEEPPRSPKRRRRPRPVSQDEGGTQEQNNHCDTTTAPQDVVMPTPLVPVKKTEPVDSGVVHLKTELPDDVPQVDVQDLTLDDDDDFNNDDMTQPGTSFSETSQDFAQWQQQMATQSGADETFMAATQGINQTAGSQGAVEKLVLHCSCGRRFSHRHHFNFHAKWECGKKFLCQVCKHDFTQRCSLLYHMKHSHPEFYVAYKTTSPTSVNSLCDKNARSDIDKMDFDVKPIVTDPSYRSPSSYSFKSPAGDSKSSSFKPFTNATSPNDPGSEFTSPSCSIKTEPHLYPNLTIIQSMKSSRTSPGYRSITPSSDFNVTSSSSHPLIDSDSNLSCTNVQPTPDLT